VTSLLTSPEEIRTALDELLPTVVKPSRYLGLEGNLIRKSWSSVPLHAALAFPDAYEIGMSHLGSRILYHLINRRDDALAERSFAPMPDMIERMRGRGVPLYTLESYRPVGGFDLVGISLQSELNYSNIPLVLGLAGIPLRAEQRAADDPVVLGGGPCTANPEPVATFFDALVVGDAEASLDAVLDLLRRCQDERADRATTVRLLATLPGVYVPQLYRWCPASNDTSPRWERREVDAPFPIRRQWAPRLDPSDQPNTPLVPCAEVVQNRLSMEIMRGCTRGCRFCQAGYWYRPVREHDPDEVVDHLRAQVDASGMDEISLLSLSTTDYSQIEPLVHILAAEGEQQRVSVSLPSLRADAFSVELAEAVSRVRKSGFTFAPETGSDRLRRVINKGMTNADMVRAAEAAFRKGWNLIKVYAMIGLPTETDRDLEELAHLAQELVRVGRACRGKRVEVKVSVGCFVPKPWTPFQWEGFVGIAELQRRCQLLRGLFAGVRGARLTWSEPAEAALEALLARGDRRLSAVIERASARGALFDGWSDHLNLEAWHQALQDTGIDLEAQLGPREMSEVLPWDIIDAGVRKGFLKAERRRALRGIVTDDCRTGTCYRCGIPGAGSDIMLAEGLSARCTPPNDPVRRFERNVLSPPVRSHRFRFSKTDDARFLSHRQLMDALERAMRAAQVPVRFTEGFNPHVRLSMGPALALGHEGLAELVDVACSAPVNQHHVRSMNERLPAGVEILDVCGLLPQAPSLGKVLARARYWIAAAKDTQWPHSVPDALAGISDGIYSWQLLEDGALRVELNLRDGDGPTPSIKVLLTSMGVAPESLPLIRVRREALLQTPIAIGTGGPA
jgi:radical SAM family uncharacterized protein/radical SAM-linked protein